MILPQLLVAYPSNIKEMKVAALLRPTNFLLTRRQFTIPYHNAMASLVKGGFFVPWRLVSAAWASEHCWLVWKALNGI